MDKPHFIDRGSGIEPASTEEVAGLVIAHPWHHGIAFFPNCVECKAAKERGEYPQWFDGQAES